MNVTEDIRSAARVERITCPALWRAWDALAAQWSPAFLWRDRTSQEVLLALGVRQSFASLSHCQSALRHMASPSELAPRAFCAVAFDPRAPMLPPWEEFESRLCVLPEVLIRWNAGEATVLSFGDVDVAELLDSLQNPPPPQPPLIVDGTHTMSKTVWTNAVQAVQAQIAEGSVSKVVLARESMREASSPISAGFILEELAASAKDCYLFAHRRGGATFLGATPERLFKLRAKENLYTESLAGTRPRGRNEKEDKSLADELLGSVKERNEQEFVTGFLRQAAAKLCRQLTWSVVPELRKLATVQHLCAQVNGELQKGVTLDDVMKGLHPTPAVCGTPRDVTREMIVNLEPRTRGLYAGAIGWIEAEDAEFAVAIRSALIKDRIAHIFAGAGIVSGSDTEAEWKETALKMKPILSALKCENL